MSGVPPLKSLRLGRDGTDDTQRLGALGLMGERALSPGIPGLKIQKQVYFQPLLLSHLP